MAWTTPKTWVATNILPAASLNTDIRDNTNFLRSAHACRLYKSANQQVLSGNADVVTFDLEDYDTDTLHDTATNNSRITIPTGFGGYWHFVIHAGVDADTTGHLRFDCSLRKNAAGSSTGGTLLQLTSTTGHLNAQDGEATTLVPLLATDYIEGFFTSNGEARILQSGVTGTTLTAFYLGQ
jgi:hypothetical protein